jgi:Skp family chaperone for outer membrane proteins
MSGEDYAQAVRALEERLTRAQREMRETKASLDRLYNRGMLEIDRTIVTIAEELAVERGAQMVLPKAAVLLVRNELEVTDAVVGRLNARLPTLDLEALIPRP